MSYSTGKEDPVSFFSKEKPRELRLTWSTKCRHINQLQKDIYVITGKM